MKLIGYRASKLRAVVRPAAPRRGWIDGMTNRFAYRCLPLAMGNQYGWEVLSPYTFEALWTGGASPEAVTVRTLDESVDEVVAWSHFGEGTLSFNVPFLFRTEEPYNLVVMGPTNIRKDGIVPLTAVVETNWLPFSFTMNWAFTRPGVPVRFEKGEPYCQFFPVPRNLLEEVEPEWHDLAEVPELRQKFQHWLESRNTFNRELAIPGSEASRKGWQRFYQHGTNSLGVYEAIDHRTRLHLREFSPSPEGSVEAPAEALPELALTSGCPAHRAEFAGTPVERQRERIPPPDRAKGPDARGADATAHTGDPDGDWLMVHPAVLVDQLADDGVVYDPRSGTSLRVGRAVFNVLQEFRLPRPAADVLPPSGPRRDQVAECVRQLQARGFLAPLSSVLEEARAWPLSSALETGDVLVQPAGCGGGAPHPGW